jgi:hypothetical protein
MVPLVLRLLRQISTASRLVLDDSTEVEPLPFAIALNRQGLRLDTRKTDVASETTDDE